MDAGNAPLVRVFGYAAGLVPEIPLLPGATCRFFRREWSRSFLLPCFGWVRSLRLPRKRELAWP